MTQRWTNESVLKFAGSKDPIIEIQTFAKTAALDALQAGWKGPPFDPFELCDILGVRTIPSMEVSDAVLAPISNNKFEIFYNPNQPHRRIKFSIAHEISHTFFPDCREQIRKRSKVDFTKDDDWQLEMLCNIGAAELLMPFDQIPGLMDHKLTISFLMGLQKNFDVSLESIILRIIKLTHQDCAVFCASSISTDINGNGYKFDYLIPSRNCTLSIKRNNRIPINSVIRKCLSIGNANRDSEKWSKSLPVVDIDCLALAPYKGQIFPRVIGILSKQCEYSSFTNKVQYTIGDATYPSLITGQNAIIAHIVNNKAANWGGFGFAKALKKVHPDAAKDYRNWAKQEREQFSMGNLHCYQTNGLSIVSMVCQKGYGESKKPRIHYAALEKCLIQLGELALEKNAIVHMPRIGAGQAGGLWKIIESMILENLCSNDIRVFIYDLPVQKSTIDQDQIPLF